MSLCICAQKCNDMCPPYNFFFKKGDLSGGYKVFLSYNHNNQLCHNQVQVQEYINSVQIQTSKPNETVFIHLHTYSSNKE